MAQILTTLPSTLFPSALDSLSISTDANKELSVIIMLDTQIVFSSNLTADGNGLIVLYNLSSLLRDWLSYCPTTLSIRLGTDAATTYTILPFDGIMAETAEVYCTKSFLTTLRGTKLTTLAAKEALSFYDTAGQTINADIAAKWMSHTDYSIKETTQTGATTAKGQIYSIDVSPSTLTVPEGYTLISYTLTIGNRTQQYRILPPEHFNNCFEVLFRNAFGQMDSFMLYGTQERELKTTRSDTIINGQYFNYVVQSIPQTKSYSGAIPDGMLALFDDLVSAKEIWRSLDYRPLFIIETEDKQSDNNDAINEGTITWREADNARCFTPNWPSRTFDKTFDATFF